LSVYIYVTNKKGTQLYRECSVLFIHISIEYEKRRRKKKEQTERRKKLSICNHLSVNELIRTTRYLFLVFFFFSLSLSLLFFVLRVLAGTGMSYVYILPYIIATLDYLFTSMRNSNEEREDDDEEEQQQRG
jgi:acyl-CoA hydrolase